MQANLEKILSYTVKDGDCLVWTRCLNTDGYPRAAINGNANGKIHRVVWELYNGKSAQGYVVRHTCDNPKCINPDHLIIGTNLDNIQDRTDRDRAHGIKQRDVPFIKEMYHSRKYKVPEIAKLFSVSNQAIYYTIHHRK